MLSLGFFPLLPPGLYDCVILGGLYLSNSESVPRLHLFFFFWSPRRLCFQWSSPVGLGISWTGDHFISSDSPSCCCHACAVCPSWAFSICSCVTGGNSSLGHQPPSFLLECQEGEVCMFQNMRRGWAALDRKHKCSCSVYRMGFSKPFWGQLSFLQSPWFL